MIATTEILKQDALGRVRVPFARRRAILREFEGSGSTAAEFARLAGIKYQTFCTWVQKEKKQCREAAEGKVLGPVREKDQGEDGGPVRLFEALVEGDRAERRSSGGLVVELPGGSRMEIASPVHAQMAAELVVLIAQRIAIRC